MASRACRLGFRRCGWIQAAPTPPRFRQSDSVARLPDVGPRSTRGEHVGGPLGSHCVPRQRRLWSEDDALPLHTGSLQGRAAALPLNVPWPGPPYFDGGRSATEAEARGRKDAPMSDSDSDSVYEREHCGLCGCRLTRRSCYWRAMPGICIGCAATGCRPRRRGQRRGPASGRPQEAVAYACAAEN